jgi:hypothetical protein
MLIYIVKMGAREKMEVPMYEGVTSKITLWNVINKNRWKRLQKSTLISSMIYEKNILTIQDKDPTSSIRSMNYTVEHSTQSNIPTNCPKKL